MTGLLRSVIATRTFFFKGGWMTVDAYMWLGVAGLGAGFVDSVAGGGGLITVPSLMYAGLPVHLALGTNKLQSSFGTSVAVWRYWNAGLISRAQVQHVVLWTFVASILGALCVGIFSDAVLRKSVPILLIGIAIYMVAAPHLSKNGSASSKDQVDPDNDGRSDGRTTPGFGVVAGGCLGFYDGFFGPGTGAFWTMAWMSLQGLGLVRATAATKVVNLASNVGSLVVFISLGEVRWDCAGVMIAGQLLGARIGSGLAIKKGASLIRPMFTLVVVALAVRLLMR